MYILQSTEGKRTIAAASSTQGSWWGMGYGVRRGCVRRATGGDERYARSRIVFVLLHGMRPHVSLSTAVGRQSWVPKRGSMAKGGVNGQWLMVHTTINILDTSTYQSLVCVFLTLNRSFYPSTSSTTSVRPDSSILEEIQALWSCCMLSGFQQRE